MPDLARLTEQLLDAATRAGAEAADAIATHGTALSIETRSGALEHAERSEGVEIGLRVLIGQRQACVSASDISARTVAEMAERAVAMARLAPIDPWIGLADPSQLASTRDASNLDLVENAAEPDPASLQNAALSAEAAALAVKGISQVDNVAAGYGMNAVHLSATNGFSGGYARSSHWMHCIAITGEGLGMERDHYGESRVYRGDLPAPEEIGRLAAERALARARPRKPRTGTYPVLYDERVASGLIGHLLQASNGAAVARGGSWLKDKLGEQILPRGISITEDPLRPRVNGSKPFDGEGLPTSSRKIVEDGVLQGWTLDLATGRQLGMPSTANAARGTSSPPSPSISNIALTESDQSRDELIREMGTGLLVTGLIGASINQTTGDYSRGASGFWVENGEIAHPVNELTIAGNLLDILGSVRPANDARHWTGRVVPSLLVEGLTVAGE